MKKILAAIELNRWNGPTEWVGFMPTTVNGLTVFQVVYGNVTDETVDRDVEYEYDALLCANAVRGHDSEAFLIKESEIEWAE